jgi:hypothetical protein
MSLALLLLYQQASQTDIEQIYIYNIIYNIYIVLCGHIEEYEGEREGGRESARDIFIILLVCGHIEEYEGGREGGRERAREGPGSTLLLSSSLD